MAHEISNENVIGIKIEFESFFDDFANDDDPNLETNTILIINWWRSSFVYILHFDIFATWKLNAFRLVRSVRLLLSNGRVLFFFLS